MFKAEFVGDLRGVLYSALKSSSQKFQSFFPILLEWK